MDLNPKLEFCLDVTEPGRAIGYMFTYDPADPADDWSIFGTRENGVWNVWTDNHGSATGHTLAAAAKRWARHHGLEHGTARLGSDVDGSEKIIEW